MEEGIVTSPTPGEGHHHYQIAQQKGQDSVTPSSHKQNPPDQS